MELYDPRLCYILDYILGLYGLIITGMFIKEKVGGPSVGCFLSPCPVLSIIEMITTMIHLCGFQFFTTKARVADDPIYSVSLCLTAGNDVNVMLRLIHMSQLLIKQRP